MRHFIILVVLFLSATAFSQTTVDSITVDSIITAKPATSIVIQKIDTVQIARIDDIEKRLSAFYTYNHRSHTLLYLSLGMSVGGILLANGQSNTTTAIISLAGSAVGLIGTIIYLDSYKFLNFKPKRREIREMTYY